MELENISRREFLRYAIGGVSLFSLVGCYELEPNGTPLVSVEELSSNPERYNKKRIQTTGFLEYIGEESYLVTSRGGISLIPFSFPRIFTSEIVLPSYKLHTHPDAESPSFLVTEEGPGIHLSPERASPGTFYKDEIKLTGVVYSDSNRKYFLKVLGSSIVLE